MRQTRVAASSEGDIEGLREEFASAKADIAEVLAVNVVPALIDACEVSEAVLSEDASNFGGELAVLLHVVEGGELLEDSQEVREIAVTII